MIKVVTLIPTSRNDGSAVSQEEQDEILQTLWMRFGGLTEEGTVRGHWIDETDGQHYQDTCLKMVIAVESERLNEVTAEVVKIGKRLGQKAMWFEVSDGVKIIRTDE